MLRARAETGLDLWLLRCCLPTTDGDGELEVMRRPCRCGPLSGEGAQSNEQDGGTMLGG